MKIQSLIIRNENLEASFKEAIVATAMGYGKIYKLLHRQLWEKDKLKESGTGYTISTGESVGLIPKRVVTANQELTINGRTAKAIKYWNIKSPSHNPYNPTDLQDLGLNQLFVGQKYNAPYEGDPKDGIYHDYCRIEPKSTLLPDDTHDSMGWWLEGNGYWEKTDEWGEVLISNVYDYNKIVSVPTMVQDTHPAGVSPYYDENGDIVQSQVVDTNGDPVLDGDGNPTYENATTVGGEPVYDSNGDAIMVQAVDANGDPIFHDEDRGMWYVIQRPDDDPEAPLDEYKVQDVLVDLGNQGSEYKTPSVRSINFSNVSDSNRNGLASHFDEVRAGYLEIANFTSTHGDIVFQDKEDKYIRLNSSSIMGSLATVKTIVYADGTAFTYTLPTYAKITSDDVSEYHFRDGSSQTLPLVYTDTGDLVQNRSDFVENWDNLFELYVHEDSYWYTSLISIAVILVSMIIAYSTGIYFSGAEWGAMNASLAFAAMGGAISGIGAVSGNKVFQILGTVLSLGTSIYNIGSKAIANQAMAKGLSERTATQIASEATFQEVFQGYVSTIGFSNLLNIGSSAYGIYSTLTAQEITQQTDDVTEDDSMKVYAIDDDDEHKDKVMELVKL